MFPNIVRRLRAMPSTLAGVTVLFSVLGTLSIVGALLPGGWKWNDQAMTYAEAWRKGGPLLVSAFGTTLLVFAYAFYRARNWVRYAIPLGFGGVTVILLIWPDPYSPPAGVGTLGWTGLSYWYFLRKRNVVAYFKTQMQVD
jgi:hypothetical protein